MIVRLFVSVLASILLAATTGYATTDAEKCEAARLKLAGSYASCMLKAEATGILKTLAPDYTKCTTKYDVKCAAIEAKYDGACSLPADCASIRDIAQCASDDLPIPSTTTTTTLPCNLDAIPDSDEDGFAGAADCDDCNDQVNPGALEIAMNGTDDDCDGATDNALAACDTGLLLADTDAMDGARALGLCQQATGMDSKWGVLSAAYVRASGAPAAPGTQVGLSDSFGSNVAPLEGSRLLVLSTGHARSASQDDACGMITCVGLGAGTAPMGFPQANPSCTPDTSISDDVGLQLQLRVPTNAIGYRFRLNFYTFDYPDQVCTQFNDQFIALASPSPMGSINGNISFDPSATPISANVTLRSCVGCLNGTSELDGTGFDIWNTGPAGATSWLVTKAPATPGGTITLRFAIYDLSDTSFDSTVLLDGFEWITSGSASVSTTVGP